MYQYLDGSGNRYIISESEIEYVPVKKEHSSSGMYSGGEPAKKGITEEEYYWIAKNLMALVDRREIHIEDRVMMSGVITYQQDCAKHKVIIKPCEEIREFEKQLKELVGN